MIGFAADFAVGGRIAGEVYGLVAVVAAFSFGSEDDWLVAGSAIAAGELHT